MSDFSSGFWDLYIGIITVASIVACAILLLMTGKRRVAVDPGKTGHVWDEDLEEYNNSLPRWWVTLFYMTIVYALGYLWFYPGLGSWAGAFKWSATGQYQDEMKQAERELGPLYQRFAGMDIKELAGDPEAQAIGQKLFLNYCAQCHAADGGGSKGFPNLADRDWLYGGEPQNIKTSILDGRNGVMPPFGAALGDERVKDVAHYVRSLSGLATDNIRVARGRPVFAQICAACHGAEGKGNPQLGAPDLTDGTWLHGAAEPVVMETITKGRTSVMPAHKEFLGEARVHILAAYVYGLSRPDARSGTPAGPGKSERGK